MVILCNVLRTLGKLFLPNITQLKGKSALVIRITCWHGYCNTYYVAALLQHLPNTKQISNMKTTINKKYTHFCVSKSTGKIVDAWEYPKSYDMDDIKDFYKMDMRDNDRELKDYKLVDALPLFKKGINPYDASNWGNN